MDSLNALWAPVAQALDLEPGPAAEVLLAAAFQAAEDEELALRIHAALAARYGLRELLEPPGLRDRYRALPPDPLAGGGKPALVAFKKAAASWRGEHLVRALEATALAAEGALPPHPTHNPAAVREELCRDCAWSHQTPAGLRCRRASQLVATDQTGCACWEPPLSGDPDPCAPCGACCLGRFDHAPVRDGDPELPEGLVEVLDGERRIPHEPACRALSQVAPWRCSVHLIRPYVCRDFPVGGDACCEARRFMGITG